jgi:hypothetical protein
LNELPGKQEHLKTLQNQFNHLKEQKLVASETGESLFKLNKKYLHVLDTEANLRERIVYIEKLIKLAIDADNLANQIRTLSALSARRFMAEEDDHSIQTAIHEHLSMLDQMKQFESRIEQVKHEAACISPNGDFLQLPVVFYDKISNTQDSIKQSLNEEQERSSSLLEIKQNGELKHNKMDTLLHNLQVVKNLLDTKFWSSSEMPESHKQSTLDNELSQSKNIESYKEETLNMNANSRPEYTKYLYNLSKCKEIIQQSKRIIGELKLPIHNHSSLFSEAQASRTSTPAPQELRDIEIQLDEYLHEIDTQIDLFENNLAKQALLEKSIDKIDKIFNDLCERFDFDACSTLSLSNFSIITSELIELEYDKVANILEQINKLKCEMNAFTYDRADLIKLNAFNVKQSKMGSLCQGFNELIEKLDLKKDAQVFQVKLEQLSRNSSEIEKKCLTKLNELKEKAEQMALEKKQLKLNKLRDTLDLELDNLVTLKYLNDEQHDDLLVETEDILLDKFSMDQEVNDAVIVNGNHECIMSHTTSNQQQVFFQKITEIDICQEQLENNNQNKNVVDIKITRECMDSINKNESNNEDEMSHMIANRQMTFNDLNADAFSYQEENEEEQIIDDDDDYDDDQTFNITVIHDGTAAQNYDKIDKKFANNLSRNLLDDTAVDMNFKSDDEDSKSHVTLLIEREEQAAASAAAKKKAVSFADEKNDLLETRRFERISKNEMFNLSTISSQYDEEDENEKIKKQQQLDEERRINLMENERLRIEKQKQQELLEKEEAQRKIELEQLEQERLEKEKKLQQTIEKERIRRAEVERLEEKEKIEIERLEKEKIIEIEKIKRFFLKLILFLFNYYFYCLLFYFIFFKELKLICLNQ